MVAQINEKDSALVTRVCELFVQFGRPARKVLAGAKEAMKDDDGWRGLL